MSYTALLSRSAGGIWNAPLNANSQKMFIFIDSNHMQLLKPCLYEFFIFSATPVFIL